VLIYDRGICGCDTGRRDLVGTDVIVIVCRSHLLT
jgi:hypothetical protein